jgi:hypothetical protein
MARKINPEKDKAASAAPAKARRKTPTSRPKRSTAAETPVSSIEDFETEAQPAVSETETGLAVRDLCSAGESAGPSPEEVARLAYHYWLDRGGQHGSAEQDWLRAERDLRHGTTTLQ